MKCYFYILKHFLITGGWSDKFVVTPQICLAINDIDYVLQFISPFVQGINF